MQRCGFGRVPCPDRCVKALRASGCELIVALTHLSLHQDKQLAESCDGIHVILGGSCALILKQGTGCKVVRSDLFEPCVPEATTMTHTT